MKSIDLIFFLLSGLSAAGEASFKTVGPTASGLFDNCRITFPFGNPQVYLGRPWRESPSATFVRCEMGAWIRAEGWQEWNVKPPLVRFAEYACTGPGAAIGGRLDWVKASADSPPAEFGREKMLGNWQP